MKTHSIQLLLAMAVASCLTCCKVSLADVTPAQGESFNLLSDDVAQWLASYTPCDSSIGGHHEDRYFMKDMQFSWAPVKGATAYGLVISEDKQFSDPDTLSLAEPSASISGLKTGCTYWWKVLCDKGQSKVMSFSIDQTPRTVRIEGVSNTRDIGGYDAYDEEGNVIGRIKQGLLYRGGRMNDEVKVLVTDEGKRFSTEVLGIATDLDLRSSHAGSDGRSENGGLVGSPLGPDVNYVNINAPVYSQIFQGGWEEKVCAIMHLLANPESYPVYIHCSIGRDRTGLICWMVETLCGMSQRDAIIDYELSFFSQIAGLDSASVATMHQQIDPVVNTISEYVAGGRLEANLEKYLMDMGVPAEDIQSIKDIFIERK